MIELQSSLFVHVSYKKHYVLCVDIGELIINDDDESITIIEKNNKD